MIVIKLGGGRGLHENAVLDDLAAMDQPWILVHGGNAELDAHTRALGREPRFVTSPSGFTSRATDDDTMRDIQMVYRGHINNRLVTGLVNRGVMAVGLSGIDGASWHARRKQAIRVVEDGRRFILRGDRTGRIDRVDVALVSHLIAGGYRPVMTLPALAEDGTPVNVDGDRAAAVLAGATGASELIILSDVPGLLRGPSDPATLVDRITRDQMARAMSLAQGRMKKKILGAQEALAMGVPRVVLATANRPRPIEAARAGRGTVIA